MDTDISGMTAKGINNIAVVHDSYSCTICKLHWAISKLHMCNLQVPHPTHSLIHSSKPDRNLNRQSCKRRSQIQIPC